MQRTIRVQSRKKGEKFERRELGVVGLELQVVAMRMFQYQPLPNSSDA